MITNYNSFPFFCFDWKQISSLFWVSFHTIPVSFKEHSDRNNSKDSDVEGQ